MTIENEWVKKQVECAQCRRKSAMGTMLVTTDLTGGYCSQTCIDAAGRGEQPDYLGDTPAHLRELLRDMRRETPGMVVIDDGTGSPYLMRPNGEWSCINIETRRQSGWNPGKGDSWIREYLSKGRVYPTADARRIGREEFGMGFEDKTVTVHKGTSVGMSSPHCRTPELPSCACGATTNLRDVVTQRKERRGQPTLTVYVTRCGACEQERRRAEVRADLDRKLPAKKPEASRAPASWPEGAGDDYEL
jgi:hypothetical protein